MMMTVVYIMLPSENDNQGIKKSRPLPQVKWQLRLESSSTVYMTESI
jgi:hypothetical protein